MPLLQQLQDFPPWTNSALKVVQPAAVVVVAAVVVTGLELRTAVAEQPVIVAEKCLGRKAYSEFVQHSSVAPVAEALALAPDAAVLGSVLAAVPAGLAAVGVGAAVAAAEESTPAEQGGQQNPLQSGFAPPPVAEAPASDFFDQPGLVGRSLNLSQYSAPLSSESLADSFDAASSVAVPAGVAPVQDQAAAAVYADFGVLGTATYERHSPAEAHRPTPENSQSMWASAAIFVSCSSDPPPAVARIAERSSYHLGWCTQ